MCRSAMRPGTAWPICPTCRWSSAFLPAIYQGTYVKNEWVEGEPFQAAKVIPNVTNADVDAAIG